MTSVLNIQLEGEKAFGIPLKECDQTVLEDTFCIIEKHWGHTFVYRYSRLPTLYLFHPYSSVRRASIAFTTHVCYDIVLIIIVFINLVDLAIPDSLPLVFERVCLIFYISEAVHQTVARGFLFGSYSYLKNPWMCFDFIITLLSLPDFELTVNTSFAIQSLRGVRSLNLISKIPGIEMMAQGIILSMFRMYGVAMIICLFLLSISLAAKQLFMGISHRRCVKYLSPEHLDMNITFSDYINNNSYWDTYQYEYIICGNQTGAKKCNINFTCLTTDEHETDFSSFDTFSHSLLNSFRLLTQDEWEDIYDRAFQAFGTTSIFFFFPVIFLGSFFLLNLMLIVVATTFDSIMNVKNDDQPLRNFKYDSFFRYDIKRFLLYPLPTSPEVLNRVFKERNEIMIQEQWLNKIWQELKNIIALKLTIEQIDDSKDFNSLGNWKKLRMYFRKISDSKLFRYFILLTIIINTVLMASEHSNMSKLFTKVLKYCYMVITGIFVFELTLKLIAYGKNFFATWWNILDLIVITLSLASSVLNLTSDYSIFRSLRLLELVKVQQAWPALHRVVTIVLSSIGNIIRLLIVVLLVMFTFAVIGNRILGQNMKSDVQRPRWSFATFGGSLFTVFKIFAGEWYIPLSDCVETAKTPLSCFIVIIPFYVVGFLVILNVFTAVLLSAFDASSLGLSESEKQKEMETLDAEKEAETSNENESSRDLFKTKFQNVVYSPKFEKVIFVLVFGSCITMALEDITMESDIAHKYVIEYLDLAFTILFTIEVLVRWLAIGVKKYFANSWMKFDFLLVLNSMMETPSGEIYFNPKPQRPPTIMEPIPSTSEDSNLQKPSAFMSLTELLLKHAFNISERDSHRLKSLRALRPLRLIPRWKSLQLVADSLLMSLPAIFHVVLVVLFIWLPFAILGVQFFAGKFFVCVDEYKQKVTANIYSKTDCLKHGYTWMEMFYNFNHIGNSYLSLFQLAMFTGWTELVEMMVDFNSEDLMPVHDNHTEYYAFVVVFVFLGAFFSLNMFVAVAVDTFKNTQKVVKMKKNEKLLTERQRLYYAAMLRLGKKKPVERTDRPSNIIMNICYTITYSLWFRVLILIFIFANTVVIALHSHNDPPFKKMFLHYCDRFFTVSYLIELILIKLVGLRKFFFYDFWNVYDSTLVCLHFMGEFLYHHDSETEINPLSFLYAFRLLRVLRLLRLTDMVIDLRRLLHSMVASIPALINISVLLLIIVFIYSILGISFFIHLDFHEVITSTLNFQTFIQSFLLLFRLTTAQGWEEVLESLSVQPPFCSVKEGNCGNFVIAVIFILSFVIISNIILVNIFIAVILENYIEAVVQESDIINDDNLADFYKQWKEFDPKATQFISYEQLSDFLDQLNKDMRIPKPNDIQIAYMNLPLMEGRKIHCLNVLKGILDIKSGDIEDSATFRILCDQVQKKYDKMFPKLKSLKLIDTTMQLKQRDLAARVIQRNLKKMREEKNRQKYQ